MDNQNVDGLEIEEFHKDLKQEVENHADKSLILVHGESRVIQSFGPSIAEEGWANESENRDIKIDYCDPEFALKKKYKFMCSKILVCNEALKTQFKQFHHYLKGICTELVANLTEDNPKAELIRKLFAALNTKVLNLEDDEEFYYFGQIQIEPFDNHSDFQKLFLLTRYEQSDLFALDLIELIEDDRKSFAFFPGQHVLVKALNQNGVLRVKEIVNILDVFPLKFSLVPKNDSRQPLNITCASGPFWPLGRITDLDSNVYLTKLVEHLKVANPDILIIFGPFIDQSQAEVIARLAMLHPREESFSQETFFEAMQSRHMTTFFNSLSSYGLNTKVVFVPSERDSTDLGVFPTVSCGKQYPSRSVEYFQNPSVLDIDGIALGLTTTDILFHLSNSEKFKNSTEVKQDRLKRLASYTLEQQHFYPLLPPEADVNLEYSKYKYLKMPVTPHLLLLPSFLKPFIYDINGCVVINPGKVAQNTIARIRIDMNEEAPSSNSIPGSLAHSISAEIIKLDSNA